MKIRLLLSTGDVDVIESNFDVEKIRESYLEGKTITFDYDNKISMYRVNDIVKMEIFK